MIDRSTAGGSVAKPLNFTGASDDYTSEDIEWIARQFQIAGPVIVAPFPGRGNINLHTYEVLASGQEYLLQKVNSRVFTMPHRVMNAMIVSIEAQEKALAAGRGDPLWQPIQLVPTRDGASYLDLTDDHGWSVWRLMVRIPRSVGYKSLSEIRDRESRQRIAEEVGRGMAIYSDLTSDIDPAGVEGSLPGYRDTRLYYRQFHSILAGSRTLDEARDWLPEDPLVRSGVESHFVVALGEGEYSRRRNDPELARYLELVRAREPFTMGLWAALEEGRIRRTLIHGDTKIENFLFCSESGRVKSLVDLDTIMPFTWLADWGDMLRSLINVAGERERDLAKVVVDQDVYNAVSKGFLESVERVTEAEIAMMDVAVQVIALELGLRFLTDYLRGDTYFRLADDDPPDLNKVRAMVQLTLYERLRDLNP